MKITQTKRFKSEDYKDAPEWFHDFLTNLSDILFDLVSALSNRLTRSDNFLSQVTDIDFTTRPLAADTFPLRFKNSMGVKIQTARIEMFSRKDRTALSGPWSATFVPNQNDEIEVSFQGLENSTDYVGKLVLEG